MPIQSFGRQVSSAASGSSSGSNTSMWVKIPNANQKYVMPFEGEAGVVRFRMYSPDNLSTPDFSVQVLDSSNVTLLSGSGAGVDDASQNDYSELILALSSAYAKVLVESTSAQNFIHIERISDSIAGTPIVVQTHTSSKTVSISQTSTVILLGGGGGGANGGSAQSASSGGGGGSGYLKTFVVEPGSYPLVIGAQGNANTDGGSSTFAGQTAEGGLKGTYTNGTNRGGNGGSGGGGGADYRRTAAGGTGGSNGSSGGSTGGSGSGVPWPSTSSSFPFYIDAGVGGRAPTSYNTPATIHAGVYGGGAGGANYGYNGVSPASDGYGGGGGGGGAGRSGAAGKAGALFVAVGLV